MKSLCLFCGSAAGNNPLYIETAKRLGTHCAEQGITLYYGGACIGLMDAAATATMNAGGTVIGITPDLFDKDVVQAKNITQLIIVKSMSERKQLLEKSADAFVAMPGGFGTMDELFELLTDTQIGQHHKPVAILNVAGYYDLLIQQLDRFVADGFLRPFHRDLLLIANDVDDLFEKFRNYQNTNDPEWLKRIRS